MKIKTMKCPHCSEEIKFLARKVTEQISTIYGEDGNIIEEDYIEPESPIIPNEFDVCPECYTELERKDIEFFEDEDEEEDE
jgi:uncharacterized protein with PIN domain